MKPRFYTAWDRPPRKPTEPGSRWKKTYQLKLDKETGRKDLEEVGEEDIYEKILEPFEETKISNILARYAAGDINALNRRPGLFMDISNAPTSLLEASHKLDAVKESFDQLPAEIKAKFGQDPNQFMAEVLSGTAFEKLQEANVPIEKAMESAKEVKKDE